MNELIKLHCGPDLLALKLFPNAKEACESLASWHATIRFFPELWPPEEDVTVVVPGDGHCPRTGAVFALLSPWNVISIDPLMREKWTRQRKIKRLRCYRDKAEDVPITADKLVIVSTHGHVPLGKLVGLYNFKSCYVVSMPCCQPASQILHRRVGMMYHDLDVPSPQNMIYGWRMHEG